MGGQNVPCPLRKIPGTVLAVETLVKVKEQGGVAILYCISMSEIEN